MNPQPEPGIQNDIPGDGVWAALGRRFALEKSDLIVLLSVALLVSVWVGLKDWLIAQGWINVRDQGVVRANVSSKKRLERPLRVGIVAWPGYAGGLTANNGLQASKDSDFWDPNRNKDVGAIKESDLWNRDRKLLVDFELVDNEDELINRLALGGDKKRGIDVAWSTVDSLARQYPKFLEKGVQPRAFLQVDWSRGADAIVAKKAIEKVEHLKGQRIAVSLAASYWLLEYSLESSHLVGPETASLPLTIVQTGGSKAARQLFEQNQVDAAVLWEPDVTQAQNRRPGAHVLVDTSMANNLIADVMIARKEFIDEYSDDLTKFIEGWLFDGTPKAMSDPMWAAHVLQNEKDFRELTEAETRKSLGKVSLANFQDNVQMFLSSDQPPFDQLFKRASALWLKRGYIKNSIPAEQARDISLLKEIYSIHATEIAQAGCGRLVWTREVAMTFKPNSTELSQEAQQILNDEDLGFQIRALSGIRFCVQVSGEAPNVPMPAEVAQARAKLVMNHLALRYNRPRSDFAFAGTNVAMRDDERYTPYILLKVVCPQESANERRRVVAQQVQVSK